MLTLNVTSSSSVSSPHHGVTVHSTSTSGSALPSIYVCRGATEPPKSACISKVAYSLERAAVMSPPPTKKKKNRKRERERKNTKKIRSRTLRCTEINFNVVLYPSLHYNPSTLRSSCHALHHRESARSAKYKVQRRWFFFGG